MTAVCIILAALSIWDYPSRHLEHTSLASQFVKATRSGDTAKMQALSRKGIELLPDDPTWHYNLACSLAYVKDGHAAAFDELEKAIDLGFRNAEAIRKDADLARLSSHRRYEELIEYAKEMSRRRLMLGPMAFVDATGVFGRSLALGEQNLGWDFNCGCFVAHMKLAVASAGGNTGDLYMNRDAGHAMLNANAYPGITVLKFDKEGRDRGMDIDFPNLLVPYPLFGNCSRALTQGPYWRSLPRALMTVQSWRLNAMLRFYLSNQTWVFPANADVPPVGTHGDVFSSIAPYWITTAGRSFSGLPYLRAALEASRAFKQPVKAEIVRRGLLAPTIQTLIRKSLRSVSNEVDYVSARAHPTAFPANGVDIPRLVSAADSMTAEAIPPLAVVAVAAEKPSGEVTFPECTYATAFAWAFVLRAADEHRVFHVQAKGAAEFRFAQTHGAPAKIEPEGPNRAKLVVERSAVAQGNRVDIAVFGRNPGTGWGAPSYISFAVLDEKAPYCDPALLPPNGTGADK